MQSKTLYLLLAFAVTIAAVTAYYDDDEDDLLTDFQEYMLEKRARKGKGRGKGKGKGKGKGSYYESFRKAL
ncbi:hypothetical protein HOLleu_22493 [Holothuria leucospilota]|uniref:Uncharacterized protein n=1 Tax=Holothuria leucospilota TaxID=206669 RepID=A0A9Q1H7J7_HOLLE|nr:hypothetical protein HOLleu_22493 [Holothuria leucospilota]